MDALIGVEPNSAVVCVRRPGGGLESDLPWGEVSADYLGAAEPWRTFRWYKGQKHYSGSYWASVNRNLVIYESRLELARLLLADFDPAVRHIVAQPFLLKARVDGRVRKHIPDYLLLTDAGPVIVDVKPRDRLSKPEVAFTFAWTQRLVHARDWTYEVFSEPHPDLLENVRLLAGRRRDWLFDAGLLEEIRNTVGDDAPFGAACHCLPGRPEELVRAALLHLVWAGELALDLETPLSRDHVLRGIS